MKKIFTLIFCALLITACQPKAIQTHQLITEPIYDASLSEHGELALVSTANSGLQLWDLKTNQQRFTWIHNEANNSAVDTSISPNLAFAASLSRNTVALWNIADGSSQGWWSLPSSGQSVAVANNGALLIGLNDGSVMSLRPNSSSLIKFLGHTEKVNSVSLSADGRLALTGSNDRHAILWNAATGQPIHDWLQNSRVISVALNQAGTLSFIGGSTNIAKIIDNNQGEPLSQLKIFRRKMNFSTARFSNHDTLLLTGTPAREVIVWSVETGKKIANWQVQRTKRAQIKGAVVYSVANSDPNQIISISSNGLVETWSVPIH